MINLKNVSKFYKTPTSRKTVLHNVTCAFPTDRNIGILGMNGAGKSTLLRLLAGSEWPDTGDIVRHGRVSFPLAFEGTLHPKMTGRENVNFVARLYGCNSRQVLNYVADFADIGAYFDMAVETYSSGMRARLSFGLCLAIQFDVYLVDEITAVGDARFQVRCHDAFRERMRNSRVVMVSHSFDTIRGYCDAGAILQNGSLNFYDSVEDAIDQYRLSFSLPNA